MITIDRNSHPYQAYSDMGPRPVVRFMPVVTRVGERASQSHRIIRLYQPN